MKAKTSRKLQSSPIPGPSSSSQRWGSKALLHSWYRLERHIRREVELGLADSAMGSLMDLERDPTVLTRMQMLQSVMKSATSSHGQKLRHRPGIAKRAKIVEVIGRA